jgi:hypothetical protein
MIGVDRMLRFVAVLAKVLGCWAVRSHPRHTELHTSQPEAHRYVVYMQ